jgi:hypothetical protein
MFREAETVFGFANFFGESTKNFSPAQTDAFRMGGRTQQARSRKPSGGDRRALAQAAIGAFERFAYF